MTLQVSAASTQAPLKAILDLLTPATSVQAAPASVDHNPQEQQAAERHHLVNHINDLCDCV